MSEANRLAGRLRVLIDARMLIGGFGGVSRFVTRLIDHLSRIDSIHVIALCGDTAFSRQVTICPLENVETVRTSFSRSHRTAARRLLWEERNLPGIIRRIQPDVYHATWNTGVPARCPVPTILTLHDLIPLHRPAEYFATWTQHRAYRYATRRALHRATHITTVSQYVADDAVRTFAIDPSKITVIPNGVDPPTFRTATVRERPGNEARPTNPAPPGPPFVLYVGGHEPRKNVAGLLRAMRLYWQGFDPSLRLHLTGNINDLDDAARIELNSLPDASNIIFLGRPNDTELAAQYRCATALLMLSIDEGFGLPVLEAMTCGCPVIAANRTALPEVAGEASLLVDPDSADEVAAAINQLCHDRHSRTDQSGCAGPSLRQRLIAQGRRRAAQFTWHNAADRFAKLYQSLLIDARTPVVAHPTPAGRTLLARDFSPW